MLKNLRSLLLAGVVVASVLVGASTAEARPLPWRYAPYYYSPAARANGYAFYNYAVAQEQSRALATIAAAQPYSYPYLYGSYYPSTTIVAPTYVSPTYVYPSYLYGTGLYPNTTTLYNPYLYYGP